VRRLDAPESRHALAAQLARARAGGAELVVVHMLGYAETGGLL